MGSSLTTTGSAGVAESYPPNTLTWDDLTQTLSVNNPTGAYQDVVPSSEGGVHWIDGGNLVSLTATPGQEPSISTVAIPTTPPPLATGDGYSSDPQGLWVKVLGVGADGTVLLQHEINVPSSPSGLAGKGARIYALSKFDLVGGNYVLDTSVGIDGYAYRSSSVNKTDVRYQDGEFAIIPSTTNWNQSGDFVLSQSVSSAGNDYWQDLTADDSGMYTVVGSGFDEQIELAVRGAGLFP